MVVATSIFLKKVVMSILKYFFGNSTSSDAISNYNAAEFKEAIQGKKVQLVDVRTASEFHSGHISKAVNIDFFKSGEFENSFQKFDKEIPVYVYCRSGARSMNAAKRLAKMGFKKIVNLKGGYMAWN